MNRIDDPDMLLLNMKLSKLKKAVQLGRSRAYCLSLWSDFVRTRDGQRCVDCHLSDRLSAHHIFRKVMLNQAQYDPGNGITLCQNCHSECHADFNRRPDLSQPIDAEGGEKLHLMERLYCILHQDAADRGLFSERFYSISESVISTMKRMQGYSDETFFPGGSLEQAYLILATPERNVRDALLKANGVAAVDDAFLPGKGYFF